MPESLAESVYAPKHFGLGLGQMGGLEQHVESLIHSCEV